MTRKPVYRLAGPPLRQELLGHAASWAEVAVLLNDRRCGAADKLSRENSEGPRGFFIKVKA